MTRCNHLARGARAAALLLIPILGACSDPFGPQEWDATPDTATIWSASRAELVGKASAFDFAGFLTEGISIESPTSNDAWDVVLLDDASGLALAPASYFEGQGTRSGIAVRENTSLSDVVQAPSDTASYQHTPVPLRMGTVYIIRTRVAVCETGVSTGTRYAKIAPVEIDAQQGLFRFEYVRNPYCSNRDFVPPNTGN